MTVEAGQAGGETPALSAVEQASLEVGQRGFQEPTNTNMIPPSGPQRPDYIPEKFWKDGKADYEGLAKSYAELERQRSAAPKQEETPAAQAPQAQVGADGKITPPAQEEAPAANPLQTAMEAARTEFAASQQVSEDTVAALEAAGIPREIFSLYLEGVKATSAQALTAIHGYTDGEQNYAAMSNWAAEKLSDAELEAYNSALDNPQLRENAVRGLYARYTAARPSEGKLVAPNSSTSQAGDVYRDRAELTRDQRDPRYATDARFRQDVMDKLQRSQAVGFQVAPRSMFEQRTLSR
jgi:hypothetical protein